MTHPPAPAPLPPEEIVRRIDSLLDRRDFTFAECSLAEEWIEVIQLARVEIEAGRAGAERVRMIEENFEWLRSCARSVVRLHEHDVPDKTTGLRACLSVIEKRLAKADAALRQPAQPASDMVQQHEKQLADWVDAHPVLGPAHGAYMASKAAQPADGAQIATDYECENCIGMPEYGCYCKAHGAVAPGGPAPASPAQVGAQPAGRVEPKRKSLAELQAELADVERQISEATSWGAGLAALDEWRRDLKRDIARATPPTAGAGDDAWDRECVKCGHKWQQVDWGNDCPSCEGDIR